MKDITAPVLDWAKCSSELWTNWFKARKHGAYAFSELEEKLCELLVCREAGLQFPAGGVEEFFSKVRVQYLRDIHESRQVFVRQHSGNIIGAPRVVKMDQGSLHRIRLVDTAGTMLSSQPYAEVVFGNETLLEPIENLVFLFDEAKSVGATESSLATPPQ